MKNIPLEKGDHQLVLLFRALAHPARLRILRLLAERRECICRQIVEQLPLAQATVSQHLKVLKQAGLIVGHIDGPATCYCLAPGALAALHQAVATLAAEAGDRAACCVHRTSDLSEEETHGLAGVG